MKLVNIALVSATLLALVTVGCKKDDSTDDTSGNALGTSEAQLVEDDSEAAGTDDDLESGVDEPLSGASDADPGNTPDAASDEELLGKVKENAGKFFKPAGCLVSTLVGKKLQHEFKGCSGPFGLAHFDGTITSTYVREPGKLTVTHEANGFTANGAQISGTRVIVYTRAGGVITKTRTGDWTGTTAKNKPIAHTANFVTTYDVGSTCITRDGSAQTTIGGRSYERTIDGYKRCGIGRLGCPESGTLTLSRTKSAETLSLKIQFEGGVDYTVTRPNGKEVARKLVCTPSAG